LLEPSIMRARVEQQTEKQQNKQQIVSLDCEVVSRERERERESERRRKSRLGFSGGKKRRRSSYLQLSTGW